MSTWSNYLRSQDWIYEKDCVVCSRWPKAERAKRRLDGDYLRLDVNACPHCWAALWQGTGACEPADGALA